MKQTVMDSNDKTSFDDVGNSAIKADHICKVLLRDYLTKVKSRLNETVLEEP